MNEQKRNRCETHPSDGNGFEGPYFCCGVNDAKYELCLYSKGYKNRCPNRDSSCGCLSKEAQVELAKRVIEEYQHFVEDSDG
jgi:hypothetical protein